DFRVKPENDRKDTFGTSPSRAEIPLSSKGMTINQPAIKQGNDMKRPAIAGLALLSLPDMKIKCHCRAATRQSLLSFPVITPRHLRNKTAICDTLTANRSNLQNQRR
ncbi:hypothetical protein, partial [uncultured Treponema sp.]|uniref:hypothetical protein n=1 Tax=uncultured Treponema sp. TaxID=162155 RepID=UPI0026120CD3